VPERKRAGRRERLPGGKITGEDCQGNTTKGRLSKEEYQKKTIKGGRLVKVLERERGEGKNNPSVLARFAFKNCRFSLKGGNTTFSLASA
jgi:hypothetical protein